MGHIGIKSLRTAVNGLDFDDCSQPSCAICSKANIKCSPFPHKASHRATRLLERIHSDICGPLPPCFGSYRYFILFIDCFSRFTSLYLMKARDEAPDLFMHFRSAAENFTKQKVTFLRVDNVPELIKGRFLSECVSAGISYEKTVPDTPNQNSVAERSNLTLASMARAMLLDADLSSWFWPFAIQTAVHIKNRVPHSNLPLHVTPYELWHHEKPNLAYFRVFGSHCTSRVLSNSLTKFEPCGESGRFLGYANDSKGYIIWTTGPSGHGGSVKIHRDVHFHDRPDTSPEHIQTGIDFDPLPVHDDRLLSPSKEEHVDRNTSRFDFQNAYASSSPLRSYIVAYSFTSDVHPSTVVPHHSSLPSSVPGETNNSLIPAYDSYVSSFLILSHCVFLSDSPLMSDTVEPLASGTTNPRPKRNVRLPKKYSDYVHSDTLVQQLLVLGEEEVSVQLNDETSFFSAISSVASTDALLCSLQDDGASDPSNISEARQSKYWTEWLSAIHEELESLKSKGVYEEVDTLPPGRKAVACKWVLHVKRDKDGSISRFKARLVAKGFTQIPGQDFTCTFAPIAHWDSIRSPLCIAANRDYSIRQLDVKSAYLNGPLEEEIYMKAPDGFTSSSRFWLLHKGLYGLRQAGRQWYLTLHQAYSDIGFSRCDSDWSVYTRRSPSAFSMSATSVDDIIVASDSQQESDLCARQINDKFLTTDCGDAEWILGCRITRCRSKRLLMIDQSQFVCSILRDFGLENCNPVKTPCPDWRLTKDMCPRNDAEQEIANALPYRTLVGKCMYLATCTRPDIAYAVRELARFMSNYGVQHFAAAKFLLRYLQGTRSQGIVYGNSVNISPTFFSFADSDWAMSEGRKSVSGYVVMCADGPISWSSKQQTVVALSSCEAEYISCAHCARQIIWLRSLFSELGYPQNGPSVLRCDNQGTVICTHDPHDHNKMKHIDIRIHFIRDCVNRQLINVEHIPGVENPSDILTKPLQWVTHRKWLHLLRLDVKQENLLSFPSI